MVSFVLLCTFVLTSRSATHMQAKNEQAQATDGAAKQIFVKYCASCHGMDSKGSGPAAFALTPPPPDLTTLARRHHGRYPAGYVGALLKFGRSPAAHGSGDMPVWGAGFKEIDPVHDPTGQQHIDMMVVYIASLQAK